MKPKRFFIEFCLAILFLANPAQASRSELAQSTTSNTSDSKLILGQKTWVNKVCKKIGSQVENDVVITPHCNETICRCGGEAADKAEVEQAYQKLGLDLQKSRSAANSLACRAWAQGDHHLYRICMDEGFLD